MARRQLLSLGFSKATISRWQTEGRLARVHRGVYAIGPRQLDAKSRWMAAVLACGKEALLSHRSGTALWGMLPTSASRIDVSLPRERAVRARDRIRVHHTLLHPGDRSSKHGIPVTSPMRTLLDLADVAAPRQVRAALEGSIRLGLYDHRALGAILARSPGRRGLRTLPGLLAELGDDPPDLRSELERRFLELVRAWKLPLPATNVVVEGFPVDAYWPQQRLVVELDSYGYHRSRERFEEDHERTERLQNAGLEVRRFTRRRIHERAEEVGRTLRRALAGP